MELSVLHVRPDIANVVIKRVHVIAGASDGIDTEFSGGGWSTDNFTRPDGSPITP